MERLPTELLAHILRTDEDPAASYTSSAFKRHQAGLRKLCTVSRCLCRVARPLVWRVVVVETDKQAASLSGLLSSPSSSDLAAFPVALAAVQRDPEETQARGLDPDPLVATTVTRLVAKLPDLEQLYLVGFGPSEVKSTRVDGKIGLDFSSSGPLRKLRRLVITDCAPYLKRVLAPAAHALVELALPAVLEGSVEDVNQVLSASILPNLRRLRLGTIFTRGAKQHLIETGPSPAFIAQLDFLHLVGPPMWLWDGATGEPPGSPFLTTNTPTLVEVDACCLASCMSSPAFPLVRHLYVRSIEQWSLIEDNLSSASLDVLYVHESLFWNSGYEWERIEETSNAAGFGVGLVVDDELAVILPAFVACYSPSTRDEDEGEE